MELNAKAPGVEFVHRIGSVTAGSVLTTKLAVGNQKAPRFTET
jgi:hypothetical protein